MSKKSPVINKLIKDGVKKLRLLGFRNVSEENILSDEVYKIYFGRILEINMGNHAEHAEQINELLQQIKHSLQKPHEPNH